MVVLTLLKFSGVEPRRSPTKDRDHRRSGGLLLTSPPQPLATPGSALTPTRSPLNASTCASVSTPPAAGAPSGGPSCHVLRRPSQSHPPHPSCAPEPMHPAVSSPFPFPFYPLPRPLSLLPSRASFQCTDLLVDRGLAPTTPSAATVTHSRLFHSTRWHPQADVPCPPFRTPSVDAGQLPLRTSQPTV